MMQSVVVLHNRVGSYLLLSEINTYIKCGFVGIAIKIQFSFHTFLQTHN